MSNSSSSPPAPPNSEWKQVEVNQNRTLGIVSVTTGAVSFVLAIIPFISFLAWLPALAAIILGILVLALKKPGKVLGIVGLVLGAIAIFLSLIVSLLSLLSLDSSEPQNSPQISSNQTEDNYDLEEDPYVPPPPATDNNDSYNQSSIPSGFLDPGTGVAYKFTDDNCEIYEYCVTVALYAYTDCPAGVEVVGNEIDYDNDVIYGETWEDVGIMYSGEQALVEVGIFDPRATGIQLTDIACYY